MDNIAKKFFYMEVERQCKFALMAYEDLQQALTDGSAIQVMLAGNRGFATH